jgi:ATPase related to the helicase subunit of the Holliday junction resolvase
VYVLNLLNEEELDQILDRALEHESIALTGKAPRTQIINASSGDARRLINIVEQIALAKLERLDADSIGQLLQEKISIFDKGGDVFYQQLFGFFINRCVAHLLMVLCIGWQEC